MNQTAPLTPTPTAAPLPAFAPAGPEIVLVHRPIETRAMRVPLNTLSAWCAAPGSAPVPELELAQTALALGQPFARESEESGTHRWRALRGSNLSTVCIPAASSLGALLKLAGIGKDQTSEATVTGLGQNLEGRPVIGLPGGSTWTQTAHVASEMLKPLNELIPHAECIWIGAAQDETLSPQSRATAQALARRSALQGPAGVMMRASDWVLLRQTPDHGQLTVLECAPLLGRASLELALELPGAQAPLAAQARLALGEAGAQELQAQSMIGTLASGAHLLLPERSVARSAQEGSKAALAQVVEAARGLQGAGGFAELRGLSLSHQSGECRRLDHLDALRVELFTLGGQTMVKLTATTRSLTVMPDPVAGGFLAGPRHRRLRQGAPVPVQMVLFEELRFLEDTLSRWQAQTERLESELSDFSARWTERARTGSGPESTPVTDPEHPRHRRSDNQWLQDTAHHALRSGLGDYGCKDRFDSFPVMLLAMLERYGVQSVDPAGLNA